MTYLQESENSYLLPRKQLLSVAHVFQCGSRHDHLSNVTLKETDQNIWLNTQMRETFNLETASPTSRTTPEHSRPMMKGGGVSRTRP